MAVFVDEHGLSVDGVHQKLVRGGEAALGLQVEAGETLVVEYALGGFVAIQGNDVASAVSTAGGFPGRCSSVPRTPAGGELWARQAAAREAESTSAAGRIASILVECRIGLAPVRPHSASAVGCVG